jgi:hypothetical protein
METTKLRRIIDKYKFTNILKIITVLIVLVLLARTFLPSFAMSSSTTTISRPSLGIIDVDNMKITNGKGLEAGAGAGHVEGFTNMSYAYYGNQVTLQDPTNKPIYRGNTCTFNLDGMYRLEALTIIFNEQKNMSTNSSVLPFKNNNNLPVYIQYQDGNGNLRYIQSSNNTGGIPNFNNNTDLTSTSTSSSTSTQTYQISKNKLVDENNLAIYTSSIVITVGDTSNKIDSYQDVCDNGYISKFGFWGSTRDMLSKTEFEQLAPSLGTHTFIASPNNANSFNQATNSDTYTFTNSNDFLTYGLALTYTTAQLSPTSTTTTTTTPNTASSCSTPPLNTDGPFKLSITYDNGLYPGNNFKINQTYIVRNDPLALSNPTSKSYIQFSQPLIAKAITITVPRANIMDGSARTVKLNITGLGAYGVTPSNTDIANYQKNVNLALTSGQSSKNQDVCPSMDELVSKQNQAQAVCDNLEYQDKIKAEKIRLEKNKQYLLKLQQQQQQIDQLNTVIQTLDTKRQARATANDQARVLQYQQQRGTASTIRDLANQRLQSQAANQLYMDVNINTV